MSLCTSYSYDLMHGTPGRRCYGAPLFPIIAILYVETFETQALETVNLRPKLRIGYMDVVFAVPEHGEQLLKTLHDYLNNQHPAIRLAIEVRVDGGISV